MKWLVTGGVGFIGTNLVEHLLERGHEVAVFDDLSREGVERNAAYLQQNYHLNPERIDVADRDQLWPALKAKGPFDAIAHLAGQVSLLESIRNPMRDFAVNAGGTVNILEFVRVHTPDTAVIGLSSNKIYGDLHHIEFVEEKLRYTAPEWPQGFNENLPIDFHGPYGCSKGVADQYLSDYARTYGLRTASLRQSSVYGPHQHPRSDQGWVAHLINEAFVGRLIRLNGIGKQVRDLLHASDLADLIERLGKGVQPFEVNQFNVGGGPANSLSILELFEWLGSRTGTPVQFIVGEERPSDQKLFIADISSVRQATGWVPAVDLEVGLDEVARIYGG